MSYIKGRLFRLNNGVDMPVLGFGTASISREKQEIVKTVCEAIEVGYRHIDTASIYGNEIAVGEAIRQCGIPREELFITTKIWTDAQRKTRQAEAIDLSLKKLNVGYIDLFLIHWPVPGKVVETWGELEKAYFDGKCRAIGVSNCHEHYIRDIIRECEIKPMLNQYEFHPLVTSMSLRSFCAEQNIMFEAYYLLGNGIYMNNVNLKKISWRYRKTIPQVLLRWAFQHGVSSILKSVNKNRMQENQDIFDFELSPWDMIQIDAMNKNFRLIATDPDDVDF